MKTEKERAEVVLSHSIEKLKEERLSKSEIKKYQDKIERSLKTLGLYHDVRKGKPQADWGTEQN